MTGPRPPRRVAGARLIPACLAAALLAGCSAEYVWAPDEEVARAAYRHDGPPALTLFTMIDNRTGEGAHSGLMINGSQRLIYDPAGSFKHPQLPERNDVFYGITDKAVDFYIDYHARVTYRVAVNRVEVTPEQAELALQLVQHNGPAAPAFCNREIARVLRQVPGFEDAPNTWFPKRTMRYFAGRPWVETRLHYDDSPDNRGDLMRAPFVR